MKNRVNLDILNADFTTNIVLVVSLFFFSLNILSAQKQPTLSVKFKLDIEKGDMKSALITITRNGQHYKVIDPNGGKYGVELELNSDYIVTCTKMGYITKSLILDTHIPSGREADDFRMCKITVELHPQPKDEIITYSQPVGKFKYSMEILDFDYDKDYTQTALAMAKKDEEHPVAAPKPPTPNPRPEPPPPTPPPVVEKSNPIPITVVQPVYTHVEEGPLPQGVEVVTAYKQINRTVARKVIQEDRRKLTVVTVTIDGIDIIYRKVEYNWGGIYYYKENANITERSFAKETED